MANGDFVDAIQSEISRVTEDLNHVDENLKKLTGRDFSDQRSQIRNKELGPGDDTLSRKDPVGFRSGQARFRSSLDNDEDEDGWSRRKPLREVVTSRGDRSRLSSTGRDDRFETKRRSSGGVFQRLGDPVSRHGERVVEEVASDDQGREDAAPSQIKSTISSSIAAVRPASEIQDGKSRTEAVAEMTKDRVSMGRNRRMFGALLGTLKSFKNEEARGKVKKDQRAIVEWKVEQRTQAEREKMAKEREELLQKRRERESRIRKLQDKMEDFKKHKEYENYQRELGKFIRTRNKPHVFWLPKKIDSIASKLISQTARAIEDEIDLRRNELKNELDEIIAERRAMEKSPVSREDSVEEGELRSKDARDNRDNRSTSKNLEEDEDGSDHLDYDADDLLFEDALMLSGKNEETQVSKSQRVVVQVNRSANESISERKVELVSMRANGNALGKEKKAEKVREVVQQRKGRIVVARRNGAVESVNNNNVGAAESEKVRMTIKQEKKLMKKEKKEKKRKLKESKKREKKLKKRLKKKLRKEKSSSESEDAEEGNDKAEEDDDDNNNGEKEDERENDEDVDEDSDANNTSQELEESESSFNLSKDPAPAMTEVVVQHVPISDSRDIIDTENIQVQTLVIDTANIKKDKESVEYCNGAAPALFRNIVIKREKNATPPPLQEKEMNEIVKMEGRSKQRKEASKNLITAKNQRNKEKKDESSSDDDDNVKEDEDESKSDDNSSSNESDSSAPENEKNTNDRKQPVKSPKKKQRRRRSRDSSSSGNSDSDSESEDEKDRKNRNSDRRSSPSSSSSASGSSSESSPDSSSASSEDEDSPKKKKSAAVSSYQKGRRSRSPRRAPVSKNQRSSRSSPPPASSASAKKRSRSPPASKKKSRSPVSKKKRASSPAAVSKHTKSSSSPISKKKSSRSSPVSRKRSRSPQSKRRAETKRKVSRSRSRSRGKKEKDLKSRRR